MEDSVQVIVLLDGTIVISKINAVMSELGEPDCRLTKPYLISDMKPWLYQFTDETDNVMISSDKILTLVDPKEDLLNDYLTLTK